MISQPFASEARLARLRLPIAVAPSTGGPAVPRTVICRLGGLVSAALLLLLASTGQGEAAATCGPPNARPSTGAPIPIGSIVSRTGPEDFSSAGRSAAAYFACVNAQGGINGRPIRYLVRDDQWDPEIAAQAAAKLVADEKVVAMAGSSSQVECGVNSRTYEREGLMVVAATGVPRECYYSAQIAPISNGPRVSSIVMARYAVETLGSRRIACIGFNTPNTGDWVCNGLVAWAKSRDVSVETILMDPSADATSVILDATSRKPDTILFVLPKGVTVALLVAAEQQDLGDRIKFVSAASAYDASVPKALGAYWNDRFWSSMEYAQPLDSNDPEVANWRAVLDAYGSASDPRDTFALSGYLAAKAVAAALLGTQADTLDRRSAAAAIRTMPPVATSLFCSPWYFGDGPRHNANHAGRVSVAAGGGWKMVSTCLQADDPDLADILAGEAKRPR